MQVLYRVGRIKLKDCEQIFCSFTLLYCWTVIQEVVDFSISQVLSYKKNYQRSLTNRSFLKSFYKVEVFAEMEVACKVTLIFFSDCAGRRASTQTTSRSQLQI